MSVTLTKDPTITSGPYTARRWHSSHNPVIFEFQRKDYNLTAFTVLGFGSQLELTSSSNISGVTVDDLIYIGESGTWTGTHKVVTVHPGGVNTKIVVVNIDGSAYTGTNSPGFLNVYRLSWRLQIKIYDNSSGGLLSDGDAYDDKTGLVRIDIREYLLANHSLQEEIDFFGINRTFHQKLNYYLGFTEMYDGSTELEAYSSDFYSVKAAQQLKSLWGSNLLYYQTHPSVDPIPDDEYLTHFMTASKEPTLHLVKRSNGEYIPIPHGYGFVYSNNGQSFLKIRKVQQLDANGSSLTGVQSDDLNAADRINPQILNLRAVTFLADCDHVLMWLEEGATVPGSYTGTDPVGSVSKTEVPNYVESDYVE